MLRLNNIIATPGATKNKKRLGRGNGSGHGKTAGKGGKGQTARTGGRVRPGFEGGQTPMYRRLPKKGFGNALSRNEFVIDVNDLTPAEVGSDISLEGLKQVGLAPRNADRLVIIGNTKLARKVSITAFRVTKGAKTSIEAAGGTVQISRIS